jgi:hypothetical protein
VAAIIIIYLPLLYKCNKIKLMKSTPSDYLKFWRVIRYYIKFKHQLSQADLDIILFLYTESYFGKEKFEQYVELVSWDKDRFASLHARGWIETFRRRGTDGKSLYCLSDKAKRVVRDIYRKLEGEEIPTSLTYNAMFLKNVSYTDKVYRNMILEMNAYYKKEKEKRYSSGDD